MNTEKCPRTTLIDRYLNGDLSQTDVSELERHLDGCEPCGETLRGLAQTGNDTLGDLLKQNSLDEQPTLTVQQRADEPLVKRLIEQIQSQPPTEIARRLQMVEDRAAEVLWLLQPDEADNSLGTLGHYRLTELLGSGSTGVVFAAWDTRLNREVALKVLRPSLGPSARDRFLKEARAAAGFQHENILTVFDVGEANGLAYITMQLHPGETLEERLERKTFLPEPEVRKIAAEIAQALVAAHGRGIIHRDLKPANIWLAAERDQIKLLDFGLARIADADPQLTASGILAGTPNYMSPEQTRGLELDGRSDLFSLGCLLYRCITGRLPFSSTGILATLQAIQTEHPSSPVTLNPACSADFSALVMALLEKQPERRPANAETVLHALNSPRAKWRFATMETTASTTNALASMPAFAGNGRRIVRGLIAAGITGLLGFGAWMFGSDIVRIATNQGEIVVESSDNQVKIEVLQNGSLVRIVDLATADRIDLHAGQYTIQAGSGGGEFAVTPETVTLSRGGRQVVKVSRSPTHRTDDPGLAGVHGLSTSHDKANASSDQPESTDTFEPTYKQLTFDQWLQTVRTERNLPTVCDGIVGLGELSKGDVTRRKLAIDEVTEIIAVRGSPFYDFRIGGMNEEYHEALHRFLRTLTPKEFVELIHAELKSGNSKRREFVFWLSTSNAYFKGASTATSFQEALTRNAASILETWLSAIETAARQGDDEGVKALALLGFMIQYWHSEPSSGIQFGSPSIKKVSDSSPVLHKIRAALERQTSWQVRVALLDCLATISSLDQSDWLSLAERLTDSKNPPEERASILSLFENHSFPVTEQIANGLLEYGQQMSSQPILASHDPTDFTTENSPEISWRYLSYSYQLKIPETGDQRTGFLTVAIPVSDYGYTKHDQMGRKWNRLTEDGNRVSLGVVFTSTYVEETYRVLNVLGGLGTLPESTKQKAIQWLEAEFQPVDILHVIKLLEIEDQFARNAAMLKLNPNIFAQYFLEHVARNTLEKLRDINPIKIANSFGEENPATETTPKIHPPTIPPAESEKSTLPLLHDKAHATPTYRGKTIREWLDRLEFELAVNQKIFYENAEALHAFKDEVAAQKLARAFIRRELSREKPRLERAIIAVAVFELEDDLMEMSLRNIEDLEIETIKPWFNLVATFAPEDALNVLTKNQRLSEPQKIDLIYTFIDDTDFLEWERRKQVLQRFADAIQSTGWLKSTVCGKFMLSFFKERQTPENYDLTISQFCDGIVEGGSWMETYDSVSVDGWFLNATQTKRVLQAIDLRILTVLEKQLAQEGRPFLIRDEDIETSHFSWKKVISSIENDRDSLGREIERVVIGPKFSWKEISIDESTTLTDVHIHWPKIMPHFPKLTNLLVGYHRLAKSTHFDQETPGLDQVIKFGQVVHNDLIQTIIRKLDEAKSHAFDQVRITIFLETPDNSQVRFFIQRHNQNETIDNQPTNIGRLAIPEEKVLSLLTYLLALQTKSHLTPPPPE
ncbi:MAG: protein kinase [Pirellulaceae bacterium]|nr:protein kinase [Pirellulaceae bacterium]